MFDFSARVTRRLGQLKTLAKRSEPLTKTEGFEHIAHDMAHELEERIVELEDMDSRLSAESDCDLAPQLTSHSLSEVPTGVYMASAETALERLHIQRMGWIRTMNFDALLRDFQGPLNLQEFSQLKEDKVHLAKEIGALAASPNVLEIYARSFAPRLEKLFRARKARKAEQAIDVLFLREAALRSGSNGYDPQLDEHLRYLRVEKRALEASMDRILDDEEVYFHFVRDHANAFRHHHEHAGRVRCKLCSSFANFVDRPQLASSQTPKLPDSLCDHGDDCTCGEKFVA